MRTILSKSPHTIGFIASTAFFCGMIYLERLTGPFQRENIYQESRNWINHSDHCGTQFVLQPPSYIEPADLKYLFEQRLSYYRSRRSELNSNMQFQIVLLVAVILLVFRPRIPTEFQIGWLPFSIPSFWMHLFLYFGVIYSWFQFTHLLNLCIDSRTVVWELLGVIEREISKESFFSQRSLLEDGALLDAWFTEIEGRSLQVSERHNAYYVVLLLLHSCLFGLIQGCMVVLVCSGWQRFGRPIFHALLLSGTLLLIVAGNLIWYSGCGLSGWFQLGIGVSSVAFTGVAAFLAPRFEEVAKSPGIMVEQV